MKRYTRVPLEVTAQQYTVGCGIEDGFELFSSVVTNGGLILEGLIKVTREDGTIVCPYVRNRRGLVFIREGDYIICEEGREKHVCGDDKFHKRFKEISDN